MVIRVRFHASDQNFKTSFYASEQRFDLTFDALQTATVRKDAEYYEGAYQVTPRVNTQVLPTAQKLMADDVTVKAIPYYETSNLSDGETVYIGTEVEIYGD